MYFLAFIHFYKVNLSGFFDNGIFITNLTLGLFLLFVPKFFGDGVEVEQ